MLSGDVACGREGDWLLPAMATHVTDNLILMQGNPRTLIDVHLLFEQSWSRPGLLVAGLGRCGCQAKG